MRVWNRNHQRRRVDCSAPIRSDRIAVMVFGRILKWRRSARTIERLAAGGGTPRYGGTDDGQVISS